MGVNEGDKFHPLGPGVQLGMSLRATTLSGTRMMTAGAEAVSDDRASTAETGKQGPTILRWFLKKLFFRGK
jgi:hypothetical protein